MIKEEMEKYRDEDRQQEAGQCIMGEMRKDREDLSWKEKYNKERKLRQEAEGELTIVKGISVHMSPEMREANKKIKELETRLAESLQIDESHHTLNGKLQERLTELEEENKKMHDYLNKRIDASRKAGL